MELRLACTRQGEAEIFDSIQGEGRNIGRRRTFVRLSGCNLHCVWCDTAYTWNWRGSSFAHRDAVKFDPAAEMMKLDVADVAARVLASGTEGVVITGGEPLMQQSAVAELARAIKAQSPGRLIEIETNGSIAPSADLAGLVDLFMVSPKLAHSDNEAALALKPAALRAFADLPTAAFKFVVRNADDVAEAVDIANEYGVAPARVYIMPEGVTAADLDAHSRAVIDAALAHGFTYSDRLHIRLWGQKRGI